MARLLRWGPAVLLAAAGGGAAAALSLDSGGERFLLVTVLGTVSGSQAGSALLLAVVVLLGVVLLQLLAATGRIGRRGLRAPAQTVLVLGLLSLLPAGWLVVFTGAFSLIHSYTPLDVPGRDLVAEESTWHHSTIRLLERHGLRYRTVPTCTASLPVDSWNAFEAGAYDVTHEHGRTVLHLARRPGGALTREVVLRDDDTQLREGCSADAG